MSLAQNAHLAQKVKNKLQTLKYRQTPVKMLNSKCGIRKALITGRVHH